MTAQYLSPMEIAAELSISHDAVLRAVARGDLPAVKYGRLVRISRVDLDAFLAAHAVKPKRQLRSAKRSAA